MELKTINLFYEEPNPDRWIKFDRYPRKLIRRIVRGKDKPGGQMMVALNLVAGLNKLNIPFRFNDYQYARQNPEELIGVIGKPHLIFEKRFKNPILFGASVFSHPTDCANLFEKFPNIRKMLVPGDWMRKMCEPFYGNQVTTWPVGIDTDSWNPKIKNDNPKIDFLIYDKIRWDHGRYENDLLNPIISHLVNNRLSYEIIRYGFYRPEELKKLVGNCKAVIFLCEHETQGLAYQQILATNTPILAWDRGGYWQDPEYFPKIKFEPVSSIPYWDNRCGEKFRSIRDFEISLNHFISKKKQFKPREYILENLTLEICASEYVNLYEMTQKICK